VRQQLDCSQTELGYGVVRELWAFELNRWASKSLYVHPYVIRHAHHISRRGVPVPRIGAVMAEAQGFHQLPTATHSLPSHYVNNFHLSLIQCVSSDFRLPSWLLSYFYTISQVERIARATSGNHRACQETPRHPANAFKHAVVHRDPSEAFGMAGSSSPPSAIANECSSLAILSSKMMSTRFDSSWRTPPIPRPFLQDLALAAIFLIR
jgi:hypothetical protein